MCMHAYEKQVRDRYSDPESQTYNTLYLPALKILDQQWEMCISLGSSK